MARADVTAPIAQPLRRLPQAQFVGLRLVGVTKVVPFWSMPQASCLGFV